MSSDSHILLAIEALRDGESLADDIVAKLLVEDYAPHQWVSLAAWLWARDCSPAEQSLLRHLARMPALARLSRLGTETPRDWLDAILVATARGQSIGEAALGTLIARFVAGELDQVDMALWLALVCRFDLDDADLQHLTAAMVASGVTHDYRRAPELAGKQCIRRYPTGALSEKSALILPALLASFRQTCPLVSPFMVARSLSFTGGTWDKLLSIPGFCFPHPGQPAIDAMQACGCAMVVSKDDSNPADRMLYQLRSATGTVRSIALAAASIASKQLALPAHRLLLDVRYGPGAFFDELEATALAHKTKALVEAGGIACDLVFTDTPEPGGSAIGNALEVIEAILIMTTRTDDWNQAGLVAQRDKVIEFFSLLMAASFPENDAAGWTAAAHAALRDGDVARCFVDILRTHGVGDDTSAAIMRDPYLLCPTWDARVEVKAERSGALQSIDQRALGYFINVELGGGGNAYLGEVYRASGARLRHRLGDRVDAGDLLMEVALPIHRAWTAADADRCRSFFTID